MAHAARSVPRNGGWILLLSTVTLGLQRVRQAWGLLLVTGAGMLAAFYCLLRACRKLIEAVIEVSSFGNATLTAK